MLRIKSNFSLLNILHSICSKFPRMGIAAIWILVLAFTVLPFPQAMAGVKTYTWHQKLTVELETPNGIVSGSSVTDVKADFYNGWNTMGGGGTFDVRGEAVMVEVAPGKYMFALLRGMPSAYKVFFDAHFPSPKALEVSPKLKDLRESRILEAKQYPMLVTFTDINDPASVKEVKADNLAEYFGPGVSLKSMTLSITNEPETTGELKKQLSWLESVGKGMLDGERTSYLGAPNPLANQLSKLDLKRD